MIRRCLLVVMALTMVSGCGMQMRKALREEMVEKESITRSYPYPSHRVALATFEAMRMELGASEFAKASEFSPGPKPKNPNAASGQLPGVLGRISVKRSEGQPAPEAQCLPLHRQDQARAGRDRRGLVSA
jgi:hypothetical protein